MSRAAVADKTRPALRCDNIPCVIVGGHVLGRHGDTCCLPESVVGVRALSNRLRLSMVSLIYGMTRVIGATREQQRGTAPVR